MSSADGLNSTALGAASWAEMDDATAVGYGAYAGAGNSVALGAGSIADRVNRVSVGDVGGERQITNVAAGTEDTESGNLAQLNRPEKRSVGKEWVRTCKTRGSRENYKKTTRNNN